jgi:tRNA U34 5-carboxymethylaminomethyl modifying GTPase MnmE/TrmE
MWGGWVSTAAGRPPPLPYIPGTVYRGEVCGRPRVDNGKFALLVVMSDASEAMGQLRIDSKEALQEEERTSCSVVVVGVTGDGKSSTCNTLAGSTLFEVSSGLCSATSECAHADYLHIDGDEVREMRVVDTIGLSDTDLPAEEVMRRFSAFSDQVPLGIDVFLFVVRFGRFKPEHEAALDAFVSNCGESALAHTVLVFTSCTLDAAALTDQLRSSAPASLQRLLPKLAGPPLAIENADAASRAEGRKALHAAIKAVVTSNHGRGYSNAALAEARVRHDAKAEEERAAFAAAVADWRKGSGPVTVVRETADGN